MKYTAENYISFIENGNIEKITPIALELIAKRFRELEHNEFRGPGEGDYGLLYDAVETAELYLIHPGNRKLMVVKTLKELLNISLKEAKDLMDSAPVKILNKPASYWEMNEILSIKSELEVCGATMTLK